MFKGKKSIYILLPVNLLVWGFIGYKIVLALGSDDLPEPIEGAASHAVVTAKDTVQVKLALNYDDPFLKQEPQRRSQTGNNHLDRASTAPAVQPVQQKPKPEPKPEKDIRYLGTIQNKNSGRIMALIAIDGNSHTVKKGDQVEGLTVKEITAGYVELKEGKRAFRVGNAN